MGLLVSLGLFLLLVGDLRLLPAYLYQDAVVFRAGNGDILFWQSEYIRPLDDPDEILSVHRLRLDDLGFRLPASPASDYDVIALGDSFTEGANVALPWPDVFAAETGLATRNFGFRGYGMRHHVWVWDMFAASENPDVLIIGFFGANDVYTAGLDLDTPFLRPSEERQQDVTSESVTVHTPSAQTIYPVFLRDGTPITFLSTYISWMNAAEDQLTGSVNYRVIADSLQSIKEQTPDTTCNVFVYFPSKPEVYFPYLNEGDYPAVIAGQKTVLINSDGTLHIVEDFGINLERVMDWRLNTGEVFTSLADSLGYETLNLHRVFDEAAANGEMLYYIYDTHWNQAGQRLAGETIADFVMDTCPRS